MQHSTARKVLFQVPQYGQSRKHYPHFYQRPGNQSPERFRNLARVRWLESVRGEFETGLVGSGVPNALYATASHHTQRDENDRRVATSPQKIVIKGSCGLKELLAWIVRMSSLPFLS